MQDVLHLRGFLSLVRIAAQEGGGLRSGGSEAPGGASTAHVSVVVGVAGNLDVEVRRGLVSGQVADDDGELHG